MDYWKILVVDDDLDVHAVTRLALKRLEYAGKRIELIFATSAAQARAQMDAHPDIAIIILDIVMEDEAAGLDFVHYVRKILDNAIVQIIIRTGHPGRAPEEQITIEYEINDYQEKSELTARKLKTSVITALRSYVALQTIDTHRIGLKHVIDASINVFKNQSRKEFEIETLNNLSLILSINNPNITNCAGVIARADRFGKMRIMSAIEKFAPLEGELLTHIVDPNTLDAILKHDFRDSYIKIDNFRIFGFKTMNQNEIFYIMEDYTEDTEWQRNLLEAFRLNIAVAIDNLYLYREVELARNDLVFALGEIAESRSSETGNHVKRVGEIAKILSLKLGKSQKESEQIGMAASMHDLGKLAIQENILTKPGKLSVEEFEVMKSHSRVGYEMLKSSNRQLLQAAAIIALEHHENYDGTGYPNGLSGEHISMECRIVAIADVFDALGNKRVYKEPWTKEQILDYMSDQSGKKFDPKLMTVFFENIDELLEVRKRFPD